MQAVADQAEAELRTHSDDESDDDAPPSTPPRFEPTGHSSPRPEFQTVRVKKAVGAKVDLMVVRGVQMKDVASGKESEPGILTLNDEHVRFKAAPNESGDGYSMITYLDQISRLPGPRCTGGTLGGLLKPYVIEMARQRTGEEEPTFCQLIFNTNQTACNAFLVKLEQLLESIPVVTQPQHRPVPEELETESKLGPLPAAARQPQLVEPNPDADAAASTAEPMPALDPVRLDFVSTQQLNPAVTLYVVDCEFSDGTIRAFKRRFRDFRKLRDDIVDLFPRAESWEFPAKHLIGNMNASVIEARQQGLQDWCTNLMSESRNLGPAAWAVLTTFVQSEPSSNLSMSLSTTLAPPVLRQAHAAYPQDVSAAFEAIFPLLPDRVTVDMLKGSGGGPLYEGFLYKEGRQIKKWNKRFFVLWPKEEHPQMGRILAYFEQNTQTNLFQVKGVIHIVKPVVRAPKTRRPEKYCMRLNANAIVGTASDVPAVNHLITENDKKYIIGTDEQHRMETWVQQLRQCGNANGGVLPNPVEEGWLLIQESGMMRWWKKSWVQLHENAAGDPTLVHYDSSVTWPKGTFNLNHYFIYFPKPTESLREYEIALLPRPPQTRTASEAELREKTAHYFCAEDEKQFQKWRAKLSQKGDEITHEVGELRYRECRQQRSADASSNYSPPVQVLSHRRPTARTGGVGGAGRRSQNAGVAHLHDFDILNMLGEGAFGKVLLVRHRGEKKQYAMKMMMKDAIVKGNKEAEVTKELETMISIEHPFIVQVHYAFHNQDRLFLVVDFMPGGELYHHLKKVGSFSEKQACFICAEISLALGYLHDEKDMAYRDLKPENVMFTSEGHIRLIDFGLAKWEVSMAVRSTACGTPLYMTPEGVENFHALHAQSSSNGVRVGKEADWYALGTLMYELTVGEAPFQADEQHVLLDKIRTKPVSFSGAAAALSADAKDIMMRLMTKDPSKRLGHRGQAELQGHDFFSEMDWEALEQHSAKPLYIPPSQSKENFPSAQLRKDAQRIAGMDDASSPEDERFAMWQFPRPMPAGDRTPLAEETTGSIAEEPELDEEPEPEPEPQLEPEPEPEPEPLPLEPASPAVTTQPPDAGAVSTATRDDDTPTPVIRSSWIQQHGPEEENLATDAGPAGDLEFEFVEDRIGIVLIGVDEFGEDAEDDDTPCLFIEVEDIAEGSPAAQHPQIQPGMALKSIGGKSVLGLSFNATIDVLTSAERPMKIVLGPPPPTKPAKPDEGATGDEDSGEQQALSPVPPEGVPPSRVDGAQTILSPAMAAIKGSEVDDGEELTPTLPASILAAKEAKEQELAKKSKANGKHK